MSTLEQRAKASSRRGSSIGIQSNPLEIGTAEDLASLKIENIVDARLISDEECLVIVKKLQDTRSNDELLITLEGEKQPFLFSCNALAKIVESTTSVKTKLNIIVTLSYRLTDPRSNMDYFVNLFRFSEEKSQVEDAFKFRIQALNGSLFKRDVNTSSLLSPKGGRGGRGRGAGLSSPASGRGGAGRGPGMSPVRSSVTGSDLTTPTQDQESRSRPLFLPVNGPLSPVRDSSLLGVFTGLSIGSSTETPQSSSGGPDSLSRPADSDDDSGDDSPMQISFKPFGSAANSPVKQSMGDKSVSSSADAAQSDSEQVSSRQDSSS